MKEQELKRYGERHGYVKEVSANFYHVRLYTPGGWRQYKFQKKISKQLLEVKDSVRCYVVKCKGNLESRLSKVTAKPLDEKLINEQFDELLKKECKDLFKDPTNK